MPRSSFSPSNVFCASLPFKFAQLTEMYGPVFSFKQGTRIVCVVGRYQVCLSAVGGMETATILTHAALCRRQSTSCRNTAPTWQTALGPLLQVNWSLAASGPCLWERVSGSGNYGSKLGGTITGISALLMSILGLCTRTCSLLSPCNIDQCKQSMRLTLFWIYYEIQSTMSSMRGGKVLYLFNISTR